MTSENNKGLRLDEVTTHHLGPIDWQINRGECFALSGASGSGKSLLLRAIADLDPHGGTVWLDGIESQAIPAHRWRRRVGLLPAEPSWWGERVGEHFGEVDNALFEALGLGEDVLQWEVANCSTGERQRLALVRLLLNYPDVLLLDEPTAALDPRSVLQVEELLQGYWRQHDVAVIWVSHDPSQRQRIADRHFRIVGSGLEEAGS